MLSIVIPVYDERESLESLHGELDEVARAHGYEMEIIMIDAIAPYDDTFFDALNTMIQEEPVAEQDMVAMGMLQTIGIEKGKPFKPTKKQRALLNSAANEAHEGFMYDVVNTSDPYWPGSNWSYLVTPEVVQETEFTFRYSRLLDYTYRSTIYFAAFSSAKALGAANSIPDRRKGRFRQKLGRWK